MNRLARTPMILTIWGITVLAAAAILAWISLRAMQSERDERRLTVRFENERLALWRMESRLLPMISRESVWNSTHGLLGPRFVETSNPPAELVADGQESWRAQQEFVRFRFHTSMDGHVFYLGPLGWVSADELQSGIPAGVGRFATDLASRGFDQTLQQFERVNEFATAMIRPDDEPDRRMSPGEQSLSQATRNDVEFGSRVGIIANNSVQSPTVLNNGYPRFALPTFVSGSEHRLVSCWQNEDLLLARMVESVSGVPQAIHGCVLDWNGIRSTLCREVRDLLPAADLVPLDNDAVADNCALASIPARLIPGDVVVPAAEFWSPMRVSLLLAWLGFAICAAAVGILLLGLMRLSQRRADFVSAVSHELRTPLTTFQLYTDLLSEEKSVTPEKRERYLRTLKREAVRLTSLVDNVLSFSRLEKKSRSMPAESLDWHSFVDSIRDALDERVRQSEMTVRWQDSTAAHCRVRASAAGLERILVNLIDNACKYACDSVPPEITVMAQAGKSRLEIRVGDHGPGLSEFARRRLFRPFSRSASDAAQSTHGVGLGLSLSRQVIRSMGGDLILEDSSDKGTTFLVQVPLDPAE